MDNYLWSFLGEISENNLISYFINKSSRIKKELVQISMAVLQCLTVMPENVNQQFS